MKKVSIWEGISAGKQSTSLNPIHKKSVRDEKHFIETVEKGLNDAIKEAGYFGRGTTCKAEIHHKKTTDCFVLFDGEKDGLRSDASFSSIKKLEQYPSFYDEGAGCLLWGGIYKDGYSIRFPDKRLDQQLKEGSDIGLDFEGYAGLKGRRGRLSVTNGGPNISLSDDDWAKIKKSCK